MRWLVYGSRGWIGQQVMEILRARPGDVAIDGEARLDGPAADLEAEFDRERPDRVVCLVGRTSGPGFNTIDYLEQPGKLVENLRDNLYGPMTLAFLCSRRGCHLTYMGTGCIFSYDGDRRVFAESDRPNFFGSQYSVVKGYTDRLMANFPQVLNVRIRMPITADRHPKNFITKIASYQKVVNIPNSMTVLPELLPMMVELAARQHAGTINLVNPDPISHNEVLDLYREIVDPEFEYQNFTEEEQNQVLRCRRSNNTLDTSLLQSLFPGVSDIRTAVRRCLEAMRDQAAP